MTRVLSDFGIRELVDGLRAHLFSAAEIVASVLDRSAAIADEYNPFIELLGERARERATAEDRRIQAGSAGPLSGVPITVKDHIWVAGTRSPAGSRLLADFRAPSTCVAVTRLEEAGAIVFAKTAQSEFGYMATGTSPVHGDTRNPWDPARSPGGSSAGAAVCVATGLGPVALGSDGGGSLRIPAAFCGVVGFKPSFGVVPRNPGFPLWESLNCLGPITRTAVDARLALDVIAGLDQQDRYSGLVARDVGSSERPPLRVVVSEDLGSAYVAEPVRHAFREAINRIESAGIGVDWADPGLPSSGNTWMTIAAGESYYSEGPQLASDAAGFTTEATQFIALGQQIPLIDYLRAQAARDAIAAAYVAVFRRHNATALITPTMGTEPPLLNALTPGTETPQQADLLSDGSDSLVLDASLAGLPACAIPIGLGPSQLPISMQIVGLRGYDHHVLAVAEACEKAIGWSAEPGYMGERAPGPPSITHGSQEAR